MSLCPCHGPAPPVVNNNGVKTLNKFLVGAIAENDDLHSLGPKDALVDKDNKFKYLIPCAPEHSS